MLFFSTKKIRLELRSKAIRVVVAGLLGSLLVPVVGITAPQTLPTADAAVSNGSFIVSSGGSALIAMGPDYNVAAQSTSSNTFAPTTGYTLETRVKFSSIGTDNLIFRGWSEVGPVPGVVTGGNQRKIAFEYNWKSNGNIAWAPSQLGQTCERTNVITPVVNTWYYFAVVVDPWVSDGQSNSTTRIYVNGSQVATCSIFSRQNGQIHWIQMGGSSGQAAEYGATRFSNLARYSASTYTPTVTFSTSTDSNVKALFNAPLDDENPTTSCLTNADPGGYGARFVTLAGTTLTGTTTCPLAPITNANAVITAPVAGATPQTSTTSNGQYTTTITWSGSPTTFAPLTTYTAQVTVVPVTGYTLTGVAANFFTLNGNTATTQNTANNGVISYQFPATGSSKITLANVSITAPVAGATPQTSTTSNGQFTTTITWSPSVTTFASYTSYTANVTVVPVAGWTLTGVAANFFTLNNNAATSPNTADGGVFSYQFSRTAFTGGTVVCSGGGGFTFTSSTIPNSPAPGSSGYGTGYINAYSCSGTATIPEGVTAIADGAFTNLSSLTGVDFPNTLVSIGLNAFSRTNLTSLNLPSSVTFISQQSFQQNLNLKNVTIQGNASTAFTNGSSPFSGNSLDSLVIGVGTGKVNVQPTLFSALTRATSVTLGAGVTTIAQTALPARTNERAQDLRVDTFFNYSQVSLSGTGFDRLLPQFTLSSASATINIGTTFAGYAITNAVTNQFGLAPTSYSISPSLSSGLNFDTATGLISGTPTAGAAETVYTITGTNGNNQKAATFTLTVNATSITTANVAITAPVAGATPQTSTASNGQFTTTISWSGTPTTFATGTAYTATVTVVPDAAYRLTGVSANFFTINGFAPTTGNLANAGVFTYLFPATAASVTTANVAVTAPAVGATPQTSTTSNGQFTTTITWSGTPATFAPGTAYTATVTVVPDAGYTLTGVNANLFTLNGNAATSGNSANAGVFTYLFPATAASINTANVTVTAPVRGATPQTSTTSNGQFTTTITWSGTPTTFAGGTAYTAQVTVVPVSGYTLTGVTANFFTLNGNTATTGNSANAGVFSYQFTATDTLITTKNVVINAPAAGSTPQTSTTSNGQFTTTISWSPSVTRFAAATSYTATVTVVPDSGYSLTGISANFFTLNGKAATTGNTANAGVFSYLFGIQNAICFNGSNQWLSLTTNTNLPLGNTAYTIEAFIKTGTSHPGGITSWGTHGRGATAEGQRNTFSFSTNAPGPGYIHWNSQNPGFIQGRSINDVVFNNTWHHVVAQSDGSTVRIYENGFLVRAGTYANNVIGTSNFTIGRTAEGNFFNGCMSNLRIVKGVAVYNGTNTTSANFAVPTSDLTAIQSSSTNISAITENQTVLLMNRTNNILLEDSNFGYTLTANGSPTTTYSGPFVPSDDATLLSSSIKGVTPTLGTPNSNLSSVIAGSVTLAEAQAISTSLASTFTKRVNGATTKVVKYSSGTTADVANFDAATDLTASTTTTLSNGDYFIIKVTAVDLTENFYRITIRTAAAITLANVEITAPVTGATPQTLTTSNGQFTTTISWSPSMTTFAASTAYTATVTVTPETGYTLNSVTANFFKVNNNAATTANLANAGVFTYLFPATAALAITIANVSITAPVAGATPQISTTSNGQFSTTITWSGTPTTFAAGTAYTATVTVNPASGRTLTGVSANFFTVNNNAATSANLANAGVFTYLFPATTPAPTITNLDQTLPNYGTTVNVTGTNLTGATVVKIGNTPVVTFTVVSATSLSFVVNSVCCTASTISITTPGGTVTSVATITPQPQLAIITTQPTAVSGTVGQSVTFSVAVTTPLDGGVLSYQWINGTTPIQGATSATLTFTPTAVTQAGNYYVAVYNTLSGSTSLRASNTAALSLGKATPVLSAFSAVNKTFGDASFTITAPTSDVPGSFNYQSGTTSVATVSGSTITIVGQGSSVITATFTPQNTDDYVSGGTITMTLTVSARQLATPTTPTVVVTTATLKSFTVSWTAVTNAVAYSLKIYAADSVTLLRTVSSLSGTSKLVNATDFPAIADGTTYKVGVLATGDANNADSSLSTLSTDFVTNSQYTITYNTTNSTGGTAPAGATFITGSSPYLISANTGTLVRTAHTFSGWNTAADGSGTTYLATGSVPVSPSANLVLHPKWTAVGYTVAYFGNNNTGGTAPTDSAEYLNGASVSVSGVGTLVRTGYNFSGWTTDSANTSTLITAASSITINLANIQLYAKWQAIPYTVTYNSQGGSSVTNGSYTIGGTITLPSDSTRAGYTFNGWFINSTGGTALVSSYSPPSTGNLTLFAQWTPIQYTVTYNGNLSGGGTAPVNSSTYTVGSSIPVVGNTGTLTRTGYTFSDWTLNSQGTGSVYASGSTYTAGTSNITFYARWIANPYSVTYNATSSTGGSAPTDTSTYTIGQNVPVRGNLGSLVRTGYTFSGWTDNSGGSGTVYQSGNNYVVGSANISFHPKWTANNYTITYNKNGATGLPTASTATYTSGGDAITLTSVGTMARTGYNFGGWSTTSTGSAISGTYTTTADVILYAVWTIKSPTVTYSEGSATKANLTGFPSNTSGNYGTTITLNSTISATTVIDSAQHAFMGWSDGSSVYQRGSTYLLGETSPTFTAVWAKIFAVRYTFNGGTPATGTTDIDSECLAAGNTCTDGQVITAHAAPTRSGYIFAGWVDQNNVAVSGSTFTVASNRYLLYATWTAENYAITYNTAGGSTPEASFTKQLGQTFTVAAAPTKTGHTFTGWSDGTTIVNPGVTYYVATSPVTLTAQWTTNVYTISFDPNGGSGTAISNVSYTYGGTAISLPTVGDLVRTNYTFAGWSETPSGTSVGTTYTPTMSRTLYVVWTISQYLVTYGGNGGTPSAVSGTYSPGSSSLVLPTATRANFTFQGWYSAATDGVLIGLAGATYAPSSSTTIYARWIQDSLVGVKASSLSFISSYAVNPAITATSTFSTSDSSVSITIPAGALPTGTTVTNWLLSSDEYARALLPGDNNYVLSLVVSWLNADGTVPVAPNSKPLVMTVTNSSIKAGARVYSIVGSTVQLLGVATQNGSVSVNFTTDPQIYVLQTKPGAPTNVVATSGDQSSSVVTWSAPADDGGSAIINYTVTASDGQSCISASTTCNFGGLTNGTSYTFTVSATNGIGSSDQSAASAAITPGVQAPVVVAPTTPTPTTPTTPTTPATPTPVVPAPIRAAFVKAQVPPQITKSADQFVCTPGTYSSGYTLDGVIEQGTTSVFTPVSYIYNLLFNLIVQSSISVTTSKNSATWDQSLAPAGTLVTCSVTVNGNSLTTTESSVQNTAASSAALAAQKQSITTAEAEYKAAQDANAKSYQKALVDNRTNWRADIAKNKATYDAERDRIKKMAASKAKNALTSAALKRYTAAQKKITADYKASGPAAVKARDLANKTALDTKNAAIEKADSLYASLIETLGFGVLVP